MARTSMANVLALPDAAQSWNFSLFIPRIPGSSLNSQNLTFKCKTTAIPSFGVEPVDIALAGVTKKEAGRAIYQHTFSCTFMETVDYTTYQAFRAWRDYMRSWKNNTGTNSSAYKVNLELDLYGNAGDVIQTIILAGAWPSEVADTQLDGSQSAVIDLSPTFSFDYLSDSLSW
jgi:hypothetical protein